MRPTRRDFVQMLCLASLPAEPLCRAAAAAVQPFQTVASHGAVQDFVHPGMLQNAADLIRMQVAVRNQKEPIYSGFQKLRADPRSQLTYKPSGAFEEVSRNPTVHANALEADGNAAYQLALIGLIAADVRYLSLSASILDSWSTTLKRITGADAVLCAGLAPFKMINAAELLRSGFPGWSAENAARFGAMIRSAVLPVIDDFAPFANGNWDTAAMKTMMAAAIYLNDPGLFDRALVYYMHGCGDGRLEHYIYANGQCQESGRDQQHTQLGLAHMGDCCEMAWHQGLDLYGMVESRLLSGFEYTAKYELGGTVPFVPDVDQTGKYRHQVISPRSPLRPVYEQIYNHYVNRRGLSAPWTAKAAAQLRPEGAAFGADHTGFGTLLYSRDSGEPISPVASARPGGPYASTSGRAIAVSWIPLRVPSNYILLRSSPTGGVMRIPAGGSSSSELDPSAIAGQSYSYRVEATKASIESDVVTEHAGLPAGWSLSAMGGVPGGTASCSGEMWRVCAAGGTRDDLPGGGLTFVSRRMQTEKAFSARLLPLFASQMLCAGIALLAEDGACAVLVLQPGTTKEGERQPWNVGLWTSKKRGGAFSLDQTLSLETPTVAYGRVYQPISFRFRKPTDTWLAELSTQPSSWVSIGQSHLGEGTLLAGMVVSSGLPDVSTEVLWDGVTST